VRNETGMSRLFILVDRAERSIAVIGRLMMYASCAAVVGIVVLLAGSSLRRYVLGTPITMTEEMTGLLFVATSCCCLVHGFSQNQHIRLILLWQHLPPPWRQWMEILGQAVALATIVIFVRETYAFAEFSYELGSRTDMTNILMWPWMALIPASLAVLGVAIAIRTVGNVLRVSSGIMMPSTAPEPDAPPRELL